MTTTYHTPVLLTACLDGLQIRPDGRYVDATFGGGGHSRSILEQLGPNGRLWAFDKDPDAIRNIIPDRRFELIPTTFSALQTSLQGRGISQVDGILADLGVSSHQLDVPEKGFSYRFDGPLDLRLSPATPLTGEILVNTWSEFDLYKLFRDYADMTNARKIAAELVRLRTLKPIRTTFDLNLALKNVIPAVNEYKILSRIYQAIRIAVNDELAELENFLRAAAQVVAPGGRLVIMSYHSLEDRIVKNFFQSGSPTGVEEKDFFGVKKVCFYPVNRKPILPDDAEIESNPRARSAKLRIAHFN